MSLEEFGENLLRIVAYILSQGVKKEAVVLVRNQLEQLLGSNLGFQVSPPPVLPDVWTAHLNSQPGPAQVNKILHHLV